jgi:hypothetical protein
MRREMAEDVAVAALGWMAGEPEVMGAFLSASGLSTDDLRAGVADPGFLAGLLDFVLQRDDWVLAVAALAHVAPGDVAVARAALPGGDLPHWT